MKPKKTRFELRLALPHLVVCLGVAMGFMLCAFFIGYSSGRTHGFEVASQDALVKSVRLPIAEEYDSATDSEQVSNLYARLQERQVTDGEEKELPQLERKEAPPLPELKEVNKKSVDAEDKTLKDIVAGAEQTQVVPVNKDDSGQSEAKSVAALGDAVRVLGEGAEKKPANIPDSLAVEEGSTIITEDKGESATLGTLLGAKKEITPVVELQKKTQPVVPEVKPKATERVPVQVVTKKPEVKAPEASFKPLEKKPTPKSVSVTKSVPKGWYAQIAAPEERAVAEKMAGQLRSSGFPAVIEEAYVRGSRYYRVLAGPETSSKMAGRLVQQLSREPYVKGKPFLRPVK